MAGKETKQPSATIGLVACQNKKPLPETFEKRPLLLRSMNHRPLHIKARHVIHLLQPVNCAFE
jgi:hypothetical protein